MLGGGTLLEQTQRRVARSVSPLRTHASLPTADFSRQVLTPAADRLAVLPVSGTAWNDLGDPGRVLATRRAVAEAAAGLGRPVAVGQ